MNWGTTVLTALLGGVLGGLAGLALGMACTEWYRISSREGASGYFAIFCILAGIVLGLVLSAVAARIAHSALSQAWWAQLSAGAGTVIIAACITAAWAYLASDREPTSRGQAIDLLFEVRLAAKQTDRPEWPDEELRLQLVSCVGRDRRPEGARNATFDRAAFRQDDGQWVLPARVQVFTNRGIFCVNLTTGERDDGFWPPFGASPLSNQWEWSEWLATNKSINKAPRDGTMYRFKFEPRANAE